MANGMDQTMSRREYLARRLGDLGIVAAVAAAGPVFVRMLHTLYVPEGEVHVAGRVREAEEHAGEAAGQ